MMNKDEIDYIQEQQYKKLQAYVNAQMQITLQDYEKYIYTDNLYGELLRLNRTILSR